jgi:hypothetical protein
MSMSAGATSEKINVFASKAAAPTVSSGVDLFQISLSIAVFPFLFPVCGRSDALIDANRQIRFAPSQGGVNPRARPLLERGECVSDVASRRSPLLAGGFVAERILDVAQESVASLDVDRLLSVRCIRPRDVPIRRRSQLRG